MKMAVELRKYSFRYDVDAPWVLKDCDLHLEYGQFIVLCGLSGEGKSTLLSSIAGIIPNSIPGEQQGDILIGGESILGQKTAQVCAQVGSVLQNADYQIFHSRVEDEIAFGCENMRLSGAEIAQRIQDTCKQMSLLPDAATATLSGGQKQRLITACTLAMGQKILLLDEPLANLDQEGAFLVLQTLKQLCRQGYAVLLAEHRLDIVLPWADSVVCLEAGQLREIGHEQALQRVRSPIEDSGAAPARAKTSCFELEGIGFTAGGNKILNGLDLTLHAGERVVILGENGCGKTTLLKLLAKMNKPTAGVLSHGFGQIKNKRAWFKAVGYVYQDPGYQLFMPTVREEVAFGAEAEAVAACMELFDLQALAGRHPHSLSEGQKRRLSIAAICAGSPQALLLDEPTVGQDYGNLKRIVDALNLLHAQRGMTMVTVTHDYRCAAALADRVLWLEGGCIYKDGGKELVEEYFGRYGKGMERHCAG